MKKVTAVVPVRKNSQRVTNKNVKPFGDTNLLELKLKALISLNPYLQDIVVSSDCSDMLKIASDLGLTTHKRDSYFASSRATNSEFFRNIAESIQFENMLYSPVTCPFVRRDTFIKCFELFEGVRNVVTTAPVKHHMWLEGTPLNYDIKNSPNSQDLPDISMVTYGACLISKYDMLEFGNVVTESPTFVELDEVEAVDIDTELDFKFAEFLYTQGL